MMNPMPSWAISGHLEAVKGVDGGYIMSRQMIAAFEADVEREAEQAAQN